MPLPFVSCLNARSLLVCGCCMFAELSMLFSAIHVLTKDECSPGVVRCQRTAEDHPERAGGRLEALPIRRPRNRSHPHMRILRKLLVTYCKIKFFGVIYARTYFLRNLAAELGVLLTLTKNKTKCSCSNIRPPMTRGPGGTAEPTDALVGFGFLYLAWIADWIPDGR
jgi:hypothetical protein